jgi:formamidopyrimidine-DNA glycosylase
MAELPEITNLARQLDERLRGKQIAAIEVIQPRCLNLPEDEFRAALTGAVVESTTNRGKWILVGTDRGWLLLNVGMGGELLLVQGGELPEKRRLSFEFTDGSCLSVNFWWFGYAHFTTDLTRHEAVAKLGPNALDVSETELVEMLSGQRGRVKDFLLDQTRLAGIGNAYVHDILWRARLHPLRKISTLSAKETTGLYHAIQDGLRPSLERGGASYEMDTYGNKGGYSPDELRVGYREGQPCPECGTLVEKIKTGGTSSFICPNCQKNI